MLVSMYILVCRDVKEINFEYAYNEYLQQVSGLSADDESLKIYIYSKRMISSFLLLFFFSSFLFSLFSSSLCKVLAMCLKAFQTLFTLGLLEYNSYSQARSIESHLMVFNDALRC
jgi:hypothetical protein